MMYVKLYMDFMRKLLYDFVTLLLINMARSQNYPKTLGKNILSN
jgi:hypothetical protein